jgi:hypothetical protein
MYRLEVEGELSEVLGRSFDAMDMTHDGGNTVLVGVIRDQSELHGLLQHISDFGLTLVSLSAIDRAAD